MRSLKLVIAACLLTLPAQASSLSVQEAQQNYVALASIEAAAMVCPFRDKFKELADLALLGMTLSTGETQQQVQDHVSPISVVMLAHYSEEPREQLARECGKTLAHLERVLQESE